MSGPHRASSVLPLLVWLLTLPVGCGSSAKADDDGSVSPKDAATVDGPGAGDAPVVDAPVVDAPVVDAAITPDAPWRLPGTPTAMTYWMGPFSQSLDAGVAQQYEADLKSAGYTTIIHGLIHVYPGAGYNYALYYGGLPLTVQGDGGPATANPAALYLRDLNARLKTGGTIKNLFVSIGGGATGGVDPCWQADYDFARIQDSTTVHPVDDENPFFQNLLILRDDFGIDGIDLDFEPGQGSSCHPDGTLNGIAYDDTYAALLVRITKWATHHGLMVTAAPYLRPDFWQQVLAQTNVPGEGQLIAWLNYQVYGNSDYATWISRLTPDGGTAAFGVPDLQPFLALGFSSDAPPDGEPPGPIQQRIACAKSAYPRLNAGFIWQYGNSIGKGPDGGSGSEYAQAILQGLQHPSPCDGGP
jgi:hypothetical protein